jgi:hypothetical protein
VGSNNGKSIMAVEIKRMREMREMREKRESSQRSAILNKPKSSLVGVQTQSRLAGSKFHKPIG